MNTLSIIIVNYKRASDTIECIESLRKNSYQDFHIVVVDNASDDGSVEALKARCPEITLLVNQSNLGFTGGNNVGIRHALKDGSSFILLLNNDTVVDPGMLEALLRTMHQYPKAGIVGGKIYYFGQQRLLWFAGGKFNENAASGKHIGIREEDAGQYDQAGECDYITGCLLLIRSTVCKTIGFLDESYFAYLEDADYCVRARRAGFSIHYQPRAILYHKISSTSSWDSPTYIYFNLRNKILFLRKNTPVLRWLPHVPGLLYFYGRQFARLIFKYRDTAKVRAAWFGVVDGLRSFTGNAGEGRLPELLQGK